MPPRVDEPGGGAPASRARAADEAGGSAYLPPKGAACATTRAAARRLIREPRSIMRHAVPATIQPRRHAPARPHPGALSLALAGSPGIAQAS